MTVKSRKIHVDFGKSMAYVRKTCERKRFFADEASAREAGSKAESSKPLYAYACPACDGWHLTSSRTGKVIHPSLQRLFPGGGVDYGNLDQEDDIFLRAGMPFHGSQ